MSYLLPLMKDTRNSLVLTTALAAVGLAALSNIRLSPRMMLQARKEYTTALSQTNYALRDPVLSKRDDTLAAVVLLGMFEVSVELLILLLSRFTNRGFSKGNDMQ